MKNGILLLVLGLALSGCLKTRADLEDGDEKKTMQKQVVEMQRAKAEQEVQVQSFESQFRSLNGRVEVLEHKLEVGEKKSGDEDAKVSSFDDRLKSLEQALLQMEQEIANLKKGKLTEDSAGHDKSTFDEAEDYFQQKNWKRAAALYQKFRETNPKDKNQSIATYRIGICFVELGMVKEGRVFLEETVEKYSGSKSAKLAKFKLVELSKKKK